MKQILIILIINLLLPISCKAQLNNINNDEFGESIKFNNVTLGEIMVAGGNLNKMKTFFGNDIQEVVNDTAPSLAKDFYNDNISLGFEDERDLGNNYDLARIYILNSSITVKVKELVIKIGDDKRKFNNYLFNSNSSSYNFTDADTGSVGLSFKINNLNKVSGIKLICF